MLKKLIYLANKLDKIGLYKEASELDGILKKAVEDWEYYGYSSPEEYQRIRGLRSPETAPEKEEEEISVPTEKVSPESVQKEPLSGEEKIVKYITDVYNALDSVDGLMDKKRSATSLKRERRSPVSSGYWETNVVFYFNMPIDKDSEVFTDIGTIFSVKTDAFGKVTVFGKPSHISDKMNSFVIEFLAVARDPSHTPKLIHDFVKDTVSRLL